MDPLTVLTLASKAKEFATKKFDNLAGGMTQIGGIYGNGGGIGIQQPQQQINSAPMFKANQTNTTPGQHTFIPEPSNYVPNTDFAQRIAGKQPNKLFQFLSN